MKSKKYLLIATIAVLILFVLAKTVFKKIIPTVNVPEKNYTKLSVPAPFEDPLQITETFFPDRICNILDYGATVGGKTKNTQSFEKAISDCSAAGGGHVVVPAGTFLTGPIKLKSNIDLHLEKDAEVIFSTDFSDYLPVVFSRFEGIEYYNFSPPIYSRNALNIAITGEGTFNGQGRAWWNLRIFSNIDGLYDSAEEEVPVKDRVYGDTNKGLRPSFAQFINSQIILLDGVTFVDGPMWTVHPVYSKNIIIKNIKIKTAQGPSTDGIVIDSSRNVLVENSHFSTGDDAIAIKSGRDKDGRRVGLASKNIVLRNCQVDEAHGAIAIGSEISGNVENVYAKDFIIKRVQYGFRIKSNMQRGGTAENIWIENLSAENVTEALIQLNTDYEKKYIDYEDFPPEFRNINITDVFCNKTIDSINIIGQPESTLENINLKNIQIAKARKGALIENANDIELSQVSMANKNEPAFTLKDSKNIKIENSTCNSQHKTCLSISGKNTSNIKLVGDDFKKDNKNVLLSPEVDKSQLNYLLPVPAQIDR